MSEENGNVLKYRVAQHEDALRATNGRVDKLEDQVVSIRIQMARWAFLGGGLGSLLVDVVKQLLASGGS